MYGRNEPVFEGQGELADKVSDVVFTTLSEGNRQCAGIRNMVTSILHGFAVRTSAERMCDGKDSSFTTTVNFAVSELARLVDVTDEGRARIPHVFERQPYNNVAERTRAVLNDIIAAPEMQKFWAERAHYYRPPELTINEQRYLGTLIRNYFHRQPAVYAAFAQLLGAKPEVLGMAR